MDARAAGSARSLQKSARRQQEGLAPRRRSPHVRPGHESSERSEPRGSLGIVPTRRTLSDRADSLLPARDLTVARPRLPVRAVVLSLRIGVYRGARRRARRLAFAETPV